MSARKIWHLQILEVLFKFLFKRHESRKKTFHEILFFFFNLSNTPYDFKCFIYKNLTWTLSNSQKNKKPLNLITIYCFVHAYSPGICEYIWSWFANMFIIKHVQWNQILLMEVIILVRSFFFQCFREKSPDLFENITLWKLHIMKKYHYKFCSNVQMACTGALCIF